MRPTRQSTRDRAGDCAGGGIRRVVEPHLLSSVAARSPVHFHGSFRLSFGHNLPAGGRLMRGDAAVELHRLWCSPTDKYAHYGILPLLPFTIMETDS